MSENRNSFIEATKPTDERLEALKQLYPELFTDGKLNLDVLKEITGGENPQEERTPSYYGLYWPGKRKAKIEAKASPKGTLVPVHGDGVNEDTTHNIYIEGDNLEVLRILKQSYKGRVKMIYIDPPYNTGDDFIYPDNYKMAVEEYKKLTGQTDEKGNALTTNQKSNGAFHTNWLNMMLPRLMLARELLTEDGVIFISIDDNEQANLKLLCDDIFGEENFIANLVWQKKFSRTNDATYFSTMHDHILCYCKCNCLTNDNGWKIGLLPRGDELPDGYGNPDNDPRGPWTSVILSAKSGSPNLLYEITTPGGAKYSPPSGRYWSCSKETFEAWDKDNRIWYGKDKNGSPRKKTFLSEVQQGLRPNTILFQDEVGNNQDGKQELKALFDGIGVFDNPKPVKLIETLMTIANLDKEKENIILDFFSGSATTGHALYKYNQDNETHNKYIMVQVPFNCDPETEAFKAGYKIICEIGKDRLKRAAKKVVADNSKDLFGKKELSNIGVKVYRMQESNFKEYTPVQGQDENATKSLFEELEGNQIPLVEGWKVENVLTEIILKQGFALDCDCKKVDSFTKNTVYCIKDSEGPASRTTTMYVCLDSKIDSDTIKNLKLDEKEKFVCLNSAIDDTSYARLADKGRIETI